jgi:hypothetical protein
LASVVPFGRPPADGSFPFSMMRKTVPQIHRDQPQDDLPLRQDDPSLGVYTSLA